MNFSEAVLLPTEIIVRDGAPMDGFSECMLLYEERRSRRILSANLRQFSFKSLGCVGMSITGWTFGALISLVSRLL